MFSGNIPGSDIGCVGHHFLVGITGASLSKNEALDLAELKPLGVVLRSQNFLNAAYAEWLEHFSALRDEIAQHIGREKILFAIEYDGGSTTPFPVPFTKFPEPAAYANRAKSIAEATALELASAGINVSLGPPADIAPSLAKTENFKHLFGADPDTVTEAAGIFSHELMAHGILPCPKHFPGIGSTVKHENYTLPQLNLLKEEILSRDVKPFATLIEIGVPLIMVASAFYPMIDKDYAALLSKALLKEILRGQLRFTGVAVTDDLSEPGLEGHFVTPEIVRGAFCSGCDLLYTSSLEHACTLAGHLLDAYKIRAVSADDWDASNARVQTLYDLLPKHACHLIDELTFKRHAALCVE